MSLRRASLLALLLASVAAAPACSGQAGADQTGPAGPPSDRPVAVRVEPVERGQIRGSLELVGELRAPESVEVASEVSGRIEAVRVEMGDRVAAGDLLVAVDDGELRAQLGEARAATEVARASVTRAEADLRRAETELGRKAPLAAEDLVTRQEMDDVESRQETAEASLGVAKAQIVQAEARARILADKLGDARILAPFAGWVEARYLDPGAVVGAGTKVLRLVRTDPMVARFQVTERHVGLVRAALDSGEAAVSVTVPAYPGEPFSGRLVRMAPAIDTASRAAWAEAELANAEGRLMPGMYCRVEVALGEPREALLVPARALLDLDESAEGPREARAFVVVSGVAEARRLVLGLEQAGRLEVAEGLSEGDRVVVEGQSQLRDGAKVRLPDEGRPGGRSKAR